MKHPLDHDEDAIRDIYDAVIAKHPVAADGMDFNENDLDIGLCCGGRVFFYHSRLRLLTQDQQLHDIMDDDWSEVIWNRIKRYITDEL